MPSKPTVSVALCTFNGERFLDAQLASIGAQSLPPHELVVIDDGSTDGTIGILEELRKSASFPVSLRVNSRNLGVMQNFAIAIDLCEGELIATADQDDVWLPSKLESMRNRFESDSSLTALFSNAYLIDDNSARLPETLWERVSFSARQRKRLMQNRALDVLADRFLVTGACLMFRKELKDRVLPMPHPQYSPDLLHDGWIALVASATGKLRTIDECLLCYRLHSRQQVGLHQPQSVIDKVRRGLAVNRATDRRDVSTEIAQRREMEQLAVNRLPEHADAIRHSFGLKLRHLERRRDLPKSRIGRIAPVLAELFRGGYHRFSQRPIGLALKDIVVRP